jgi:hypothetical protein
MDIESLFFGIVFLIAGILILFAGVRELIKAIVSKKWPTTIGKIVSSDVYRGTIPKDLKKFKNNGKLPQSIDKLISKRANTSRESPTYEADVFYKYFVNDIEYSSNKVSFGSSADDNPKNAQRIVNRYPQGKEVTIYYNRDSPEESVLEPGTTFGCYFQIVFGFIFTAVGFYVLFIR